MRKNFPVVVISLAAAIFAGCGTEEESKGSAAQNTFSAKGEAQLVSGSTKVLSLIGNAVLPYLRQASDLYALNGVTIPCSVSGETAHTLAASDNRRRSFNINLSNCDDGFGAYDGLIEIRWDQSDEDGVWLGNFEINATVDDLTLELVRNGLNTPYFQSQLLSNGQRSGALLFGNTASRVLVPSLPALTLRDGRIEYTYLANDDTIRLTKYSLRLLGGSSTEMIIGRETDLIMEATSDGNRLLQIGFPRNGNVSFTHHRESPYGRVHGTAAVSGGNVNLVAQTPEDPPTETHSGDFLLDEIFGAPAFNFRVDQTN